MIAVVAHEHLTTEEVVRIYDAKKVGSGWKAKCPCHDDHKASLCISSGSNDTTLIKCQAGCKTADV